MNSDDLVELGRSFYSSEPELSYWSSEEVVGGGLNPMERDCLEKTPRQSGRLLVLGLGGGREAIALAKLGFTVTGVEFVPEMARRAQENAAGHGVKIEALVQEISAIEVPAGSFDLVWLGNSMYSCVPTREKRVAMLRRIRRALSPEGYFFCSFHWEKRGEYSSLGRWARKILAVLTWGNLSYEPGDILWQDQEFIHAFSSEADLRAELSAGGFQVLYLQIPGSGVEGGAMLKTAPAGPTK